MAERYDNTTQRSEKLEALRERYFTHSKQSVADNQKPDLQRPCNRERALQTKSKSTSNAE